MRLGGRRPGSLTVFVDTTTEEALLEVGATNDGTPLSPSICMTVTAVWCPRLPAALIPAAFASVARWMRCCF